MLLYQMQQITNCH